MATNKNISENTSEDNLIQQMVSKYLPYWPIFLVVSLIAVGLAYTYLHFAVPVYEAKAVVLIKDEKKGNEDSKMIDDINQISSKKIVENEIEILQSRTLMLDVVKKLSLYAPVYTTGKVRPELAYTSSPVMIQSPSPDSLKPQEQVFFSFNKAKNTVLLNNKYEFPLNQIVNTPFGPLQFVRNPNYLTPPQPGRTLYFAIQRPINVAQSFLPSLKADASGKLSSVIDLAFRDVSRERAADILNGILESYDQASIDQKNLLAQSTLTTIDDRLRVVSHDLDSIQKKAEQYKSGQGAVDIGQQGQLYLQNVSSNDQKMSEINMQSSILDEVQKFVTSNKENNASIAPSTFGVSDPLLSSLLEKLSNYQLEYTRLRKTVGENNPTLLGIQDQINKIKPSILQNIQSQKQGLNAARQNLSSTNNNYNSILQAVPQKERDLLDITRQQATLSGLYSFLLQKKEESLLSYYSNVTDHQIVDHAQSGEYPVSPKPVIIYAVSLLACLGICFTVIAIKESLNGKVLYRHELESRTSIPIIGEVAFDKSKKPLVIESGKRSFIAEEFRKLRISLSFLGINENHKRILVTSSISGEGKSFIAANLAVSLALTGKKVVIIDLDLNNPSIAKMLNLAPEDGITEYLKGEKEPEEIIKRVKAHENLFFISAGNLPESPTELLANGRVKDIIDYLDNIFDVIIIDTSPIVLVTDGYLLTGLCDATLYVVRHKYTPKVLVKRLDETNKINPIKNPAIIFNGVTVRGFFKNNYGYGYDYVYGSKNAAYNGKRKIILK